MPIWGITASAMSGHLSSFESIASYTSTAGSTVTFSSIPSTYTHLQLRIANFTQSANQAPIFTFNSDSTSVYAYHEITGDGSSASAYGIANTSNISNQYYGNTVNTSNYPSSCVMDILDYSNSNKFKVTKSLWGSDFNGSGRVGFGSGLWRSTSAISSITITCATDTLKAGCVFNLYGIKGA